MIEVEKLNKTYGTTLALQDVSFSVEKGEILGFLGPNGAGKTTTMRILAGYLPASSGTAKVAGYDVHEQSMQVRKNIGYLPETPPLYPEMTVEGYLDFVARLKGVSAGNRNVFVSRSIQRCQLTEKRNTLIRKLSKGYRQRVGIAQSIVHDPPVIILDEPTVGLDPRQISEVRHLIRSLAGDHTIILSTHILPEVSMTCNRVAIINQGSIVATNSPAELLSQLQGTLSYDLEIEGDLKLIEQPLKALEGVISIDSQFTSENRWQVKVNTKVDQEIGQYISYLVVSNGLGLCEMRKTRPSLEDVFLELTTQESHVDLDPINPSTPESLESIEPTHDQ